MWGCVSPDRFVALWCPSVVGQKRLVETSLGSVGTEISLGLIARMESRHTATISHSDNSHHQGTFANGRHHQ